MLHRFSGATIKRTIDRSGGRVPEHAHDWPLLSLFALGGYSNHTELGEQLIAGPSAVFYAAGAAHRNVAGSQGFEQIEIEFDPAWLGPGVMPAGAVLRWMGGRAGAEARALVRFCARPLSEQQLRAALRRFLRIAMVEREPGRPAWLDAVSGQLRVDPARRVSTLARQAGLHPSWLGSAYRAATGEGLLETAARLRVERAACLLRETDLPLASVAMDAGFCDQSHMVRNFRRVLGRTPSTVRADRMHMRQ